MLKHKLIRFSETNDHVKGFWLNEHGNFLFYTLERPWLGSIPNISCIPEGVYQTEWYFSPGKKCMVLQFKNVLDNLGRSRSYCQVHKGNLVSHSKGCVLMGMYLGIDSLGRSEDAYETFLGMYEAKHICVEVRNNF